ncbi:MAG TPA: helix-turn-helix transcriptional regulator [Rubrobacter sp.]|nr:helix-turn-helix transcriptional regulator [Rubrobacter sp.]
MLTSWIFQTVWNRHPGGSFAWVVIVTIIVSRATIATIESGKRTRAHPATAKRLARVLKVRPEQQG